MGSDGIDLEELDLTAFAQDAWTADADFFAQQETDVRVAAGQGVGFLVTGKPGVGKATLARSLAEKLGVVHVGVPQLLASNAAAAATEARTTADAAATLFNTPEPEPEEAAPAQEGAEPPPPVEPLVKPSQPPPPVEPLVKPSQV
ncbi:hypothetical protein T484DRAFT_1821247 [Baffinella frigidus]|nr:hypothetical protein T484DRAFT_1821247 [Cryptophyta sp. CCMP2293]